MLEMGRLDANRVEEERGKIACAIRFARRNARIYAKFYEHTRNFYEHVHRN